MNDIMKYYLITFEAEGLKVSVPMGEIIRVEEGSNCCVIYLRDRHFMAGRGSHDTIMDQWKNVFNSLGSGLYL